ncbi:MAG TPA: cyclopropane-fatty-acyl-phospholipid synthase family protein [Pseudolabrys sp.]|nr:cyclopropane-fatty-acyl-phospholipid synthase family protein [Pseudolabrys sp.]
MNAITLATGLVERVPVPDAVVRLGIAALCERTNRKLASAAATVNRDFATATAALPIAEHVADANTQHYEVPAAFFEAVLGPQRKYSCCRFMSADDDLATAEDHALAETALHAGLADGQSILELGCGWGSLSLWMARHYPAARIVAVSNSRSQREFIELRAQAEGLANLTVVTADMNAFAPEETFDRIVSVEMFEHMLNWRRLFGRVRTWLKDDGRFFMHVFTHNHAPYRFDHRDKEDWIAQHFFTGGIMPSHDFIREFGDIFAVEEDWRWSGTHYRDTARWWLKNFDDNAVAVRRILAAVYGKDAALWSRRWRLFFLATEGLFGYADGKVWGVSHYRLKPA